MRQAQTKDGYEAYPLAILNPEVNDRMDRYGSASVMHSCLQSGGTRRKFSMQQVLKGWATDKHGLRVANKAVAMIER